jgi:phage head maturation protease
MSAAANPERRGGPEPVELREATNGQLVLNGYASPTETDYEVSFYTERVQRGAFRRS